MPAGEPSDNFFDLGGDSLRAVDVAQRVEDRLGIEFPIDAFFLDGTLGAVIEACQDRPARSHG